MSTRKKTALAHVSPQSKRKRHSSSEPSESVSDSELSELNEDDITAFERDDEDEEDDEDEDEEAEDSYEFEDDRDLSEEDARKGTQRRTIGKAGKPPQKSSGAKSSGDKQPTIRLTLKMGKEKLREATSTWTPPPGISESNAPTPKDPVRPSRGRKIVTEDSSSSEAEDDEEEDEDAEGEEVEVEGEGEGEEDDLVDEDAEGETDDELLDSDDDMEGADPFRSRTGTPDMSRLTKRQRGMLDDVYSADLLELPAGIERPSAAKSAPLTADEAALKRAEMARRRKNLTDQRLEEEKMDTINKLLKKQTPKMRKGRPPTGDVTPAIGGEMEPGVMLGAGAGRPPNMVRWVSDREGIRIHVPESWLAGPAGNLFVKQGETERMKAARGKRMVEEVE